jgi:hypothetical protein
MRVIILGIVDDIRQADPVLRGLEMCGLTISDVTVLQACAGEGVGAPCPAVSLNLPAAMPPHADARIRPTTGSFAVSTQAAICESGIVILRADRLGQRPLTVTGNVRIELPPSARVVQDLRELGIPLPEARRIAAEVRMDNVLILVDEHPDCPVDAIIDVMLAVGLSKVFMVTGVEHRDAPRPADGCAIGDGTSADLLPWMRRRNLPYF